ARDAFQVFLRPVDVELARDGFLESFVALKHLPRPSDTVHCQKSSVSAAEGGICRSQAFPVRQCAGARNTERIVSRAANGNGISSFVLIQRERLRNSRCRRIRALGCVVKSLCPHRRLVAEATLHLIRDGQRREQFASTPVGVLGGGEYRAQVVTRM